MNAVTLEQLEARHLNSGCDDSDCWCHDPNYWMERVGDDY